MSQSNDPMRFSGRYKVVIMAEFILVAVFMSESTPKLISTAASLLCSSSLGYVEKCTHPDASVSERIPWNFEGDAKI